MGKRFLAILLALCFFALLPQNTGLAAAPDKTSKYRVYQNTQILMEFADRQQAIEYAKKWANSHVEEIGTRKWIWDNLPRYKVYQYDYSPPEWEFATLEEAIAEARKWSHAAIRDLQSPGWVWHNYPRYRLYQGDITLDNWEFANLNEAIQEARKWANAHIIDLNTNKWVWDNISVQKKRELRAGPKIYQVYQGTYTRDEWKFAYLQDAVDEALKWANSHIVNTDENKRVYQNFKQYKVYQNNNLLDEFVSLDEAIAYAKLWAHSRVTYFKTEIWNNYPYYKVYQNNREIGEFHNIPEALSYAVKYADSSIRTYHGKMIWDNFRKLQFWAWHGVSQDETIHNHVVPTQGLDVSSPTWFHLADENGNLKDDSNKNTVAALKRQGLSVHPLVSNQFNTAMTSLFLNNPAAQRKFVDQLVSRASLLGVDGLNIDFENLSGKDRDQFTAFMRLLTGAAHAKGLVVSVDLPRGSVKWNHLSAFDHEKLAEIVDYIIIMTYDQHYSGSPTPGSVAGLQWTEEGVREFLSYGIPRDKLIMGIPFYVREWKLDANGNIVANKAVYLKSIPDLIREKKAKLTWDGRFNQYKVEYTQDGYTQVFWLEDERTIKARLEIAKKYDLAGVAFWRLGYDPAELWPSIIRGK